MTRPDIPEVEVRARLADAHVAIVGCGGLGSNIAGMLVRSGVNTLTLIDFDIVEPENLNRQMFFPDQLGRLKIDALAETLTRIKPEVALTLHEKEICADTLIDLVRGADVIVEAVDRAEVKATIVDVCTRDLPDTPLVGASGVAGYDSANLVTTEAITDRLWIAGDFAADSRDGHALLASRVMLAAAHEAHAVIRLLLGFDAP